MRFGRTEQEAHPFGFIRWVAATACLLLMLGSLGSRSEAATAEDEVRSTFERFIAAQNAHDEKEVNGLLIDAPDFLWITRGAAIWGREAAMKRFVALYQGTWQLSPDLSGLKVVIIGEGVAQIYVPITFAIGASGQVPQSSRFLMNLILRKAPGGWRISSILPIPVPTP